MKRRSFFSILALIVIVLLSIGAGVWYGLLSQTPLNLLAGGPNSGPISAIFVPKSAPVMVSLLTNPDRLEAFRQISLSPEQRGSAKSEFNQIKKSLLANTGLNYDRDIQPWLGNEVTFAITSIDIDRSGKNGQQQGFLAILPTENPEQSQECLELFWQKQAVSGDNLVFETYKGAQIVYRQPVNQNQLSTAIVGERFVLLANHPKVLRDAINNVQVRTLSLYNTPHYQEALAKLTQGRVGWVYFNLGGGDDLDGDNLIETHPNLAVALKLTPAGVLAETALLGIAAEPVSGRLSSPVSVLRYIPGTTPLVAASTDLQQLWQQVAATIATNPTLSQLIQTPIRQLQETWKVDLPTDIFSWVTGEYAVALVPGSEQASPDWLFVTEKSDNSQAAWQQLDEKAQAQGYSRGTFTLGEQEIVAWTRLTTTPRSQKGKGLSGTVIKAEAKAVHATVNDLEVFTTSVEAMNQVLSAIKGESFLENPQFQASVAGLPTPNNGYLYIDWSLSREYLERQFPLLQFLELTAKPFFDHLDSLTITSTGGDVGWRRASIFMRLS